jgi:hypothetical protein
MMNRLNIAELSLYKWRYHIGYGLVAIGLIAVLVFASLYSPGGISTREMESVVKSSSISLANIDSLATINLPYYLLQKACLAIFGVSIFSIKLPSLILASMSAIGMVLLLVQWFKPRIAVLSSLIAITTGQFIFIAQSGTPGILYLFWPVMLILMASIISTQPIKKYRMVFKVSFFIIAGLSLYTPLSAYILIALASAIFLHPHLRFMFRQFSKPKIIIAMCVSFMLTIPLIIYEFKSPGLILELLGIPSKWPDFGANFASLGVQYLGFANPGGTTTLMTPFFELGSMIIIGIGIYRVTQTRETAKSYVIGLWVLSLLPFLLLNPNYSSVTYLPLVILLAYGLNTLLAYWYDLFPRNPYARIGGLIPVVVLVAVLVSSGLDRYIDGYRYDPRIAPNFSKDIALIPSDTKNILVSSDERAFYQVMAKHNKQLNILSEPSGDEFLVTRSAKQEFINYSIDKIITSSRSNDSDRFYLYKTQK